MGLERRESQLSNYSNYNCSHESQVEDSERRKESQSQPPFFGENEGGKGGNLRSQL